MNDVASKPDTDRYRGAEMRDEGDGRTPENDAAEDASLMARIGQGDERAFDGAPPVVVRKQ